MNAKNQAVVKIVNETVTYDVSIRRNEQHLQMYQAATFE
jgi:hypothetical protein